MLLIVAHHYVVNSGLTTPMYADPLSGRSIFLFLFGAWGKTGINCFVLITGYFMCKSNITATKFFKLLFAVTTALSSFLFFKNLKVKYSKVINAFGASTFGVLLIHSNSDTMRHWLWVDTLKNKEMYDSPYLVLHAVVSVLAIFIICNLIDQLRILLIEKPVFRLLEKKK